MGMKYLSGARDKLGRAFRESAPVNSEQRVYRSALRVVSGVLIAFLMVSGMQVGSPASPARAATSDFRLSIDNGGTTEVSSYADQLTFETLVSPESGVPVRAGAVTTITLDQSLKMTSLGQIVPADSGATKSWDEATNTLTVTWGELFAGTTYGVTIIATPSAVATNVDTFQATAVTQGATPAGDPLTQNAKSDPIAANEGTFVAPGGIPQAEAGKWELTSEPKVTASPGSTVVGTSSFRQVGSNRSAFRNLQFVMTWGVANGSDEILDSTWIPDGMRIDASYAPAATLVDEPGVSRVYSYGAYGGNVNTGSALVRFDARVPAGTAPGTYSVPFQIVDDASEAGDVKRVVVSSSITVVVPVPAGATATLNATHGPNQVVAGRAFDWGQQISMPLPGGTVKELTVISELPEGVVARGLSGQVSNGSTRADIKNVEYTSDQVVNESSTWKDLPRSGGTITLADPSVIRGIRYVMKDFKVALVANLSPLVFGLQADESLAPGTELALVTKSMTYLDPVVGESSVEPTAKFRKTVEVIADPETPPSIAAADRPSSNGLLNFDQTYANGNQFNARFFLGSGSETPLQHPYIFIVVPKGMSATGLSRDVCSPYTWPYQHNGCVWGAPVTYPKVEGSSGSVVLSNGATLYYSRVTQGEIRAGAGAIPLQQLHALTTLKVNAMLAGKQNVLVGMGSLSDDSFVVDTARNQSDRYSVKALTEASSYGSFASIDGEIQEALTEVVGVNTGRVLMGERSFTVAPSTAVSSVTTIKGSENSTGIVQGEGTATTRPGGSVSYEVEVTNTGAGIYRDFEFIDVLPTVGDTFTLSSLPRGSEFDVTLSGNVTALVNGVPDPTASVEFSTSTTPSRFDGAGNDVAGNGWLPFTGSATGAKALRVRLASGVKFGPGDKVTLSFDATVPASAPRNGETAKNTIAYRFKTGAGVSVASEAPVVPVKSSAPVGDTQLSGLSFLDVNENSVQDAGEPGLNGAGVSLQLYKIVDGEPVAVGPAVVPNTDAGVDGAFAFVGIEPNLTYRVKPTSTNSDVTFPAAALDANGFLKYLRVTDAAINGSADTSQYVSSSSLQVGDQVGVQKWVKDLRLPLVAKTTVKGDLQFADVTNTPVSSSPELGSFLKGYTVKLMQGSVEKASTTTNGAGKFAFTSIEGLTPGDYTLSFDVASGGKLVASGLNNSAVFSGSETPAGKDVYRLNGLQPGVPAAVQVYYTDSGTPIADVPVFTGGELLSSMRVNPNSVTLSGSDSETRVAKYVWKILDAGSTQIIGATVNVGANESPVVTIPATLADGIYNVELSAVDMAGNVSVSTTESFTVDKTAPVIASESTEVTFARGNPAAPTTTAGWINLYGVTAVDAGVGMPDAGGISVDASSVNTAKAGTYSVKFFATDAAGNTAAAYEVSYIVGFVADPLITLGSNAANYEMGTTTPTAEADWKALFGGATTTVSGGATVASVSIDSTAVDFVTPGVYEVLFTVTDSLGYTGTASGALTVQDTTKPSVTTLETALIHQEGATQIDTDAEWISAYGAEATDAGSGIATFVVDSSLVDYTTAGVYTVSFTATDLVGNVQTKTVRYTVAFAGAPSISLGNTAVVYEMGDVKPATQADWKILFDAVATTAAGTTLKSLTVDHSAVDFTQLSDAGYNVIFTATDSFGNTFRYTGKLVVTDTRKPSVTAAKVTVKHKQGAPGKPYSVAEWLKMFGASAVDTTGGSGIDPNGWVVVEGVNYDIAGDYEVEFTAHDMAGNISEAVKATLTVQAPPTGDQVRIKVAQNKGVLLDPRGRSTTTGVLEKLKPGALGIPSAGGQAKLDAVGRVIYTSAKGFSGEETLKVTVTDDLGQTAEVNYTFTVVKKATLKPNPPEYSVPVDGSVVIPIADVLQAVDVVGLTVDRVRTTETFRGKVAIKGDSIVFKTNGSDWSGSQSFTVSLKDELGQSVQVPVLLNVLAPHITTNKTEGYAAASELTIDLWGLVPGQKYALELHSKPLALGTVVASPEGAARLIVTIPAGAEVGAHKVVLLNASAQERATVGFNVLPSAGAPDNDASDIQSPEASNGGLSHTGNDPFETPAALGGPLMIAGLILLAAGWVRRRMRNARGKTWA